MKFKNNMTQSELVEKLDYNPSTGIFTWMSGRRAGNAAGTPCSLGYISIGFRRGNYFKAHRLAWLYVYGRWPSGLVDHIDGNSQNNRIANLREADPSNNSVNFHTPKFNKTGFRGVGQSWDGRYFTHPKLRGVRYFMGYFDTAAEASAAYIKFRKQNDGAFFADPNRVPVTQTESANGYNTQSVDRS